jgi:surface carbohydrate biosynthesis protein (TIGR04326 family)
MKALFVFDASNSWSDLSDLALLETDFIYLFPLTVKPSSTKSLADIIGKSKGQVEIIDSAKLINSTSDRLREQYIGFVASIQKNFQNKGRNLREIFAVDEHATLWWYSLISEMNPYKSDSFNRLVQLDTIINVIKREDIDKIFFSCDSHKLKESLKEYALDNRIAFSVAHESRRKLKVGSILESRNLYLAKHLMLLMRKVVSYYVRCGMIKSKLKRRADGAGKDAFPDNALAIVTYYPNVDTGAAEKGVFNNKYYLPLQDKLQSENVHIIWIAMYVESSKITFDQALSWSSQFIHNGYSFHYIDEFMSLKSQLKSLLIILWSGIIFLRLQRSIRKEHTFNGYNCYNIFRDDWYASFAGWVGYSGILYYEMFKTLLRKLETKKCLYCCEMHAWEKALINARDAAESKVGLLAYQHATVSRMLLNYFNGNEVSSSNGSFPIPRPDILACNGQLPYRYMVESGWPKERLTIVEAIRYEHLKKNLQATWPAKRKIIIIALSISPEESSALLGMACEALRDLQQGEVWLKPHPFLALESVLRISDVPMESIPFVVKEGPVEEYLPEAKIVIAGESGVSLEALSFHCDVISISTPEWINMSPLRGIESGLIWSADSVKELREVALKLLETDTYDPELRRDEARKVISDFFYLNNDSYYPEKFFALFNDRHILGRGEL